MSESPAGLSEMQDPKLVISIAEIQDTPLSPLWLAMSPRGLVAVEIQANRETIIHQLERRGYSQFILDASRLAEAAQQLSDYLAGLRQTFELPIDWSVMRPFQQSALQATLAIPYGQTRTYREIASQLGKPRAARAVGRAEATNPLPLVIPCHRVVGSDGKLHGYGAPGGIKTKAWLLELERQGED
jgi:methylated-DNA-[protein]-cysteine S-methyltransferase